MRSKLFQKSSASKFETFLLYPNPVRSDYYVNFFPYVTELDSQKETFEQASKAVKDYDMLKENNKMVIEQERQAKGAKPEALGGRKES